MWTVAQLKPKQLERALFNLERQHFTVFNPVFSVKRVVKNRVVTLSEPVFPSYVFIELAEGQLWVPINSTFGVKRLLTRQADGSEYREPAVIADAFIAGLQRCSRRDDKDGWRLEPGTAIRIVRGPLVGRVAIVRWSSAERVQFLLNISTEKRGEAHHLAIRSATATAKATKHNGQKWQWASPRRCRRRMADSR